MDFVHPTLNEEIDAIGGHYMFTKEDILPHPKGDILYFIGYAAIDTSCCGAGGCGYAVVPGHIISLRSGMTEDNRHISEIVLVEEPSYEEVYREIRQKEGISQVHFLLASGDKKVFF